MRKREKRNRKKQDRGIVDFMMVTNHFFHSLRGWLLEMEDPRNHSYITYTQADLGYMAILKNVCGQHSISRKSMLAIRSVAAEADTCSLLML